MVQNNKCKQAKKKLPNEKCADMEKNCTKSHAQKDKRNNRTQNIFFDIYII